MATVSVAILGLGRIGASAALALKRYNERKDAQHQFEVACAELRPGVRDDAEKLGITVERNLFSAAQGKDIVVLALPYADVLAAYKSLGDDLRPGSVVLDTSPLKGPSLTWAGEFLPKEVHMVGITPVVNPKYLFDGLDDTEHAAADLFDNGNMLLMPSVTCVKEAVELAADFSTLLGSIPHFADPAEHDSMVALTEGLPSVVGVALYYMAIQQGLWDDAQRITNPPFGRLTRVLFDTHPDDLRDVWFNNRENLVRQIDELTETLAAFRNLLAKNDRAAVEVALQRSTESYSGWVNRRFKAKWDDSKEQQSPSFGNVMMNSFMGGFLSKRMGGKKGEEE
jgi:prephenate dehydrogenase